MSRVACLVLTCLLGAVTDAAEPEPRATTPTDLEEAATWFDARSWPKVAQPAYAVAHFLGDEGLAPIRGLVVYEDETVVSLLCDGLQESAIRPSSDMSWPGTVVHLPKQGPSRAPLVQTRQIEWEAAAAQLVRELQRPVLGSPKFGGKVPEQVAAFVFSRFCAWTGRTEWADRIAALLPRWDESGAVADPRGDFRTRLEASLSRALLARNDHDWNGPAPRAALLEGCERLLRDHPAAPEAAEARCRADLLRRMLAEDAEHARTPVGLAEVSAAEQAAEWIFRLRDQSHTLLDRRDREPSGPASKLIELGYAAVPGLIAALADERFSRATEVGMEGRTRIRTVGDWALLILEQISRQRFLPERAPGTRTAVVSPLTARPAVEAWWATAGVRGEAAQVADLVRRGEEDSYEAAQRLGKIAPGEALPPILAGIRQARETWRASNLVHTLIELPGEAVTAALRQLAQEEPRVPVRIAALQAAQLRKDPQALALALALWAKWPAHWPEMSFAERSDEELMALLVAFDDPTAFEAMAERLPSASPYQRITLLQTVASTSYRNSHRQAETPRTQALAERLLLSALTDKDTLWGGTTSDGHGTRADPRVCDEAAFILVDRWPERFAFTWALSRWARDQQLFRLRNADLARQGLPALPTIERSPLPSRASPNTIVDLRWRGGEALPRAALQLGQVVTGRQIIALNQQLRKALQSSRIGYTLVIERPPDGRGVTVEITWQPGPTPTGQEGWTSGLRVSAGEKSLVSSLGGKSSELSLHSIESSAQIFAAALAAPPDQAVDIACVALRVPWE